MRGGFFAASLLVMAVLLGALVVQAEDPEQTEGFQPRVIVGVPDSGINPYHEQFYRPDLTEHPCTYIEGFPCGIPALNVTVGVHDSYQEAYQADRELWEDVAPGQWYWIPQTVFVAAYCDQPYSSGHHCILDGHGHGTGTASSVLTENPDALIAFLEGSIPRMEPYHAAGIPVDIYSVSWGHVAPLPMPAGSCLGTGDISPFQSIAGPIRPIYVKAAGNEPGASSLLDCWSGDPKVISVGGAYAASRSQESLAYKEADVVSYYCRPTAVPESLDGWRDSFCGTSFAAPTVAGALSKVILELRETSGYTGGLDGEFVDPLSGVTVKDLRDALNRTASYSPEPQYDNSRITGVPLNPVAPWLQWGWGFYDGLVADATIEHLSGQEAPAKPAEAILYMETLYAARSVLYENNSPETWPRKQDDAGSGGDAPNRPVPEVWIESGIDYHGTLYPFVTDSDDHYAFWAEEGDLVEAKGRGTFNRFAVMDEQGEEIGSTVTMIGWDAAVDTSFTIETAYTGIHYFHFRGFHPMEYAFSIGINEPAPEPGLAGLPVPPMVPLP